MTLLVIDRYVYEFDRGSFDVDVGELKPEKMYHYVSHDITILSY